MRKTLLKYNMQIESNWQPTKNVHLDFFDNPFWQHDIYMMLEKQWPAKNKGWASIHAKEIPEDLAPKFWKQTQNAKF